MAKRLATECVKACLQLTDAEMENFLQLFASQKITAQTKFVDLRLANIFRQAVSKFRGDAIVHRIYPNYLMMYEYDKGTVIRIKEISDHHEKLVYEYKNTQSEMESLFQDQRVEGEIALLQMEINALLDQRNQAQNQAIINKIDQYLQYLTKCTHQIYVGGLIHHLRPKLRF